MGWCWNYFFGSSDLVVVSIMGVVWLFWVWVGCSESGGKRSGKRMYKGGFYFRKSRIFVVDLLWIYFVFCVFEVR